MTFLSNNRMNSDRKKLALFPAGYLPNKRDRADSGVSHHEQAHADPHPRGSSAAFDNKRMTLMMASLGRLWQVCVETHRTGRFRQAVAACNICN